MLSKCQFIIIKDKNDLLLITFEIFPSEVLGNYN